MSGQSVPCLAHCTFPCRRTQAAPWDGGWQEMREGLRLCHAAATTTMPAMDVGMQISATGQAGCVLASAAFTQHMRSFAVRPNCAVLRRALGDLQPLRAALAGAMAADGRLPRIVAYCNTGARSGPASVLLGKTLGIMVGRATFYLFASEQG